MSTTLFEKTDKLLTVKPNGRLDTKSSPILDEELQSHLQDITDVIMDFENVEYISSSGMRVLLALEQTLDDRGGHLRLINVNDEIIDILELVGFMDMVQVD